MKILIVDDDSVSRELMAEILEKEDTDQAEDGLEALQKCELNKYDWVLMDILMPVMDGIQSATAIKKLEQPPKILYITGSHRHIRDVDQADGILLKPINIEALKRKVYGNG